MSFLVNPFFHKRKYAGIEFPRELIYLLVWNRIRIKHERTTT